VEAFALKVGARVFEEMVVGEVMGSGASELKIMNLNRREFMEEMKSESITASRMNGAETSW
jgi:hypothetical protein